MAVTGVSEPMETSYEECLRRLYEAVTDKSLPPVEYFNRVVYVATSPTMKRLMADGAEAMGVRLAKEVLQGQPGVQEMLDTAGTTSAHKENYATSLPAYGDYSRWKTRELTHHSGQFPSAGLGNSTAAAANGPTTGNGASSIGSPSGRAPGSLANANSNANGTKSASRQDIRCYFCHGQHYMTRCRAIRKAQLEYNITPL